MSLSALEALREHLHSLEGRWRQGVLNTWGLEVVACDEPGECQLCGGAMEVQKTYAHTGKTLKHGTFRVRETVHFCRAKCHHPCGALVTCRAVSVSKLLIPGRTIGYDALVFAGMQRFVHHRQREEIRHDLEHEHGVELSTGEVSDLNRLFRRYLETLHETRAETIRDALAHDGGYPLHIDATGEDGRGTLLVALAGWRRWVLDAWKIPTERVEVILPALRSVVHRFGAPCAVVRDLGKAMIPAVDALVEEEEIRVFSCHQHFLADVGKDLLDSAHGELRSLFRRYKIRPNLGALVRELGRKLGVEIGEAREQVRVWQARVEQGHVVPGGRAGQATVRALGQWVLDYLAAGDDQGFPFDRPYLDFYDRSLMSRRAVDAFLRTPPEHKGVRGMLERLARILQPVVAEPSFNLVAERLRKRACLFDELRDALRLVPKPGGRNTVSTLQPQLEERIEELKDIQSAVEVFVASLRERRPQRGPAEDMREAVDIILEHMAVHGETLWGHIFSFSTPTGEITRVVDRTNHILEKGVFGGMKQGERRRSGRKNLTQDFEQLPPAAALTSNLTHTDYVQLLCGSLENLPEAFATLDAHRRERRLAGYPISALGRSSDPIPEMATASLPAADRPLLRAEAMNRRVAAAAQSRAPRTSVKGFGRAVATVN